MYLAGSSQYLYLKLFESAVFVMMPACCRRPMVVLDCYTMANLSFECLFLGLVGIMNI
jgi:hypothetical protein